MNAYSNRGPGFWATLTAPNTLSGSPVFNKDKEMIGLVSCGFSEENPLTYVVALYPLFTNTYTLNGESDFHLYKLATAGILMCNEISRIKLLGPNKISITLPKNLKE